MSVETPTTTDLLDEIKARASAATPGPWQWRGNVDHGDPRLTGRHPRLGTVEVLGHMPVERSATDRGISNYLDELDDAEDKAYALDGYLNDQFGEPIREDRLTFTTDLLLREARKLAIFEVCPDAQTREDSRVYRADIVGVRHPDAEFIAHSRADMDWLIGEVERLHTEVTELGAKVVSLSQQRDRVLRLCDGPDTADTAAVRRIYGDAR